MPPSRYEWVQSASDPDLPRVLARFGISPPSLVSINPLVSGSGQQQGFRVLAEHGEWALKRHTSSAVIERLEMSHALELRLARAGFPVAPLYRSDTGRTLEPEGPARYSLHGWVKGQQLSIADRDQLIADRPDVVKDLAAMVGTLHVLSGRPVEGRRGVDADLLLTVPRAAVHELRKPRRRLLSVWQGLRLKPSKSDFERWILHVLPEVASRAELLAEQSIAHRVGPCDVGVIHNDVNWENLIFDEMFRVRALLDFDNAVLAPRVLEVGSCAVVLVGADQARVEQFVSGYEAVTGQPLDRGLVRLAMELKCVRSISVSALSYLNGSTDISLLAPWCYHLYESLQMLRRG